MLQVAIASAGNPTSPATGYRRALLVLGAVIAGHLLLLALTMAARDRMVERPAEPRTIVAMLLRPEPEPVKPAPLPAPAVSQPSVSQPAVPPAAVAPPTPPAPRHAARVKPAPQPHAVTPRETQTPAPASTAPSETPQPAPAPAQTAPAATPTPAPVAPQAAPAVQPATPASTAPRNVSHVDCTIPKPDYPDISRRRGENGTAIVRFVVGLNGRLESVQLQKSSGYSRLDDAALAAVHGSECQPYTENGTPVRAAYSQSFVFGLSE